MDEEARARRRREGAAKVDAYWQHVRAEEVERDCLAAFSECSASAHAMKVGAAEVDAYWQSVREGDCLASEHPPGLGESLPGRNVGKRAGIEVISLLDDDSDDKLTIVATKGNNALADFPHSQDICATLPFAASGGDNTMYCPKCNCYVCDILSSECTSWDLHCHASHKVKGWRDERALKKKANVDPQGRSGRCFRRKDPLTEPVGQSGLDKDKFVADDASRNSKTRGVCNHFVPGGGEGWRLEARVCKCVCGFGS
jgi:hypothetical protein